MVCRVQQRALNQGEFYIGFTKSEGWIYGQWSLVIVKEDNFPPLQWKLGRVEFIYKGKDNCVRVDYFVDQYINVLLYQSFDRLLYQRGPGCSVNRYYVNSNDRYR